MSKSLNILFNRNNPNCFFKAYIKGLNKIDINFISSSKSNSIYFSQKKFSNYYLYNKNNDLMNDNIKNYFKKLETVDAAIIINDYSQHNEMLFELGYLYYLNPDLPVLYANNYNFNNRYLENNAHDHNNHKIHNFICNYRNLDFYSYDKNNTLCSKLNDFLYNIKPNDNMDIRKIDNIHSNSNPYSCDTNVYHSEYTKTYMQL